MSKSRRQFLGGVPAGLIAAAAACQKSETPKASEPPAGAPPAFGTSPEVGPPVSTTTFAEAEKLVQFPLAPADRQMASDTWRRTLAAVYERRTGPKKVAIEAPVAPATRWDPV